MDVTSIFASIIGVFVAGIAVIAITSSFVYVILKRTYNKEGFPLRDSLMEIFYSKHNDIITLYGQLILAAFVVLCITILLLTDTISPEAGLPLLAALVAYVLGKGSSAMTTSRQQEK